MCAAHSSTPSQDTSQSGFQDSASSNGVQPGRTPFATPVPRLLVDLPSRPRVFVANLRDLFFPNRVPALELHSAPAAFWHDVFVSRPLPWSAFFKSAVCHLLACAALIEFTRILALQPIVAPQPVFDHSQIVYYSAAEYLPPLDTRQSDPAPARSPAKADPEFARQPIISVPRDADNHHQTIVTPPNVRLTRDLALPDVVAWSERMPQPQLAIPSVPLVPAAEITRIQPQLDSVVAPPPDSSQFSNRRISSTIQAQVVAPPPKVDSARDISAFDAPQPSVVAPPPAVEVASHRPLGEINIGRADVIAPVPSLPVAEQRAALAGRSSATLSPAASQVVPPPPSAPGSSVGSSGRMVALSLHPAIGAPPDPPAGNRRGSFAATPEGHAGASGSAGSRSGGSGSPGSSPDAGSRDDGKEGSSGSNQKTSADLPGGLYVGHAPTPAASAPVAGSPVRSSPNLVNPNLVNPSLLGPRSTHPLTTPPLSAESASLPLTDAERVVFGGRRFYSASITSPNLNSAHGSWVVRFADKSADAATASATNLTQPYPAREVDPAYPLELMRENVHGTVILYAVIHANGSVGDVRVLRSVDPRLDHFAAAALAQWQFQPATKNGVPVDVDATFQIPFHPASPQAPF